QNRKAFFQNIKAVFENRKNVLSGRYGYLVKKRAKAGKLPGYFDEARRTARVFALLFSSGYTSSAMRNFNDSGAHFSNH
ncbi:hypothetical protein MBN60_01955, partial [Candidatus Saccharibacteria bacterium]|nr:hypothetical protein [Candidatus Saccharibacteria bacterium]